MQPLCFDTDCNRSVQSTINQMAADFEAGYFDELLERIRDIHASERRFYQKITDIYSTASNYDAKAQTSQAFFATVQNKLHWAIHGHTAAELIKERADSQAPNMGVTNWSGGAINRKDVSVAMTTFLKKS